MQSTRSLVRFASGYDAFTITPNLQRLTLLNLFLAQWSGTLLGSVRHPPDMGVADEEAAPLGFSKTPKVASGRMASVCAAYLSEKAAAVWT